jgi:hypothetical protein
MRAIGPLLCLLCCAFISGCAQQTTVQHRESALLVLDNHGGYSHAGRRVVLRSDGSYTDTGYTDVVGDERVKRGVYTLNTEKTQLTLSPARGEPEHLYQVEYGHVFYWVEEQARLQVTDPKAERLRQTSLRVNGP